ncbi:MAG: Kelch repeat-containing protein [Acidimicrobiia bacterium]
MRATGVVLLLAAAACTGAKVESTTTTSASSGWVEVAPMTIARSEHPAVALGGDVVVLGGLVETGLGRYQVTAAAEAYTPEDDTWRDLADLPQPRHHAMAAVIDEHLYVFGGYTDDNAPAATVWELANGQWLERTPLPGPLAAAAAVVLDGRAYLVGGVPDSALYRYDPVADTWEVLPAPQREREHVAAVALDGEIWAIAGRWQGDIWDSTEIYDPATRAWRPGPTLNEARSGFGALVVGDQIVAAGGEVFSPDRALDTVELLDSTTGVWSLIEPLPYGLHGNPLVAIGRDIYLPGGSTQSAGVENDGRVYRLDLG